MAHLPTKICVKIQKTKVPNTENQSSQPTAGIWEMFPVLASRKGDCPSVLLYSCYFGGSQGPVSPTELISEIPSFSCALETFMYLPNNYSWCAYYVPCQALLEARDTGMNKNK